ncbi:hypothetical protein FOXYSP1_08574 [Fusarium oxysporum f. sp. phaseoli]
MTRRSSSRKQPSISFIDWVKGHTGNPLTDDVWKDDNSAWFHYIEQRGIATELQYTIMDPLFRDMRNIQRASAERERALGHQGTSDQRPSGSASGGRHTLSGPSIIERFTVLYKAMDQAQTDGLFDSKGALNRISVLRSIPPTDFSENKTMYCFTPDYNLARKHAAWVKRRGPYAVILKIAVQDSVITAMDLPISNALSGQIRTGGS